MGSEMKQKCARTRTRTRTRTQEEEISNLQVILGAVVLELDVQAIFDTDLHLDAIIDLRLQNVRVPASARSTSPANGSRRSEKSAKKHMTVSLDHMIPPLLSSNPHMPSPAILSQPSHHRLYVLDPDILLEYNIGAIQGNHSVERSREAGRGTCTAWRL